MYSRANDPLKEKLKSRRAALIRRNKRYVRWSRNWSKILVTGLFIYVMLPFAAPTLMKLGATGPAEALYTVYSPLCHQFSFRSFFLFGEQTVYPREDATRGTESLSFDERAAQSPAFISIFEDVRRRELAGMGQGAAAANYSFAGPQDLATWSSSLQIAARRFRGDEQMGYKVALCERDIAIYIAMMIGGIGFIFVRKRLRPVPLLLYALLGLGPIGIDGFSQLLSYPPFEFWPARETLPEFRVLTGALFGLMNVWLAFPYLEKSFMESAREMETTIATILAEEEK